MAIDLTQFDQDFAPSKGRKLKVEDLDNGDYELEIVRVELTETQRTGDILLRWDLVILSGPQKGNHLEKVNFFRTPESVGILGNELLTLGFDADRWNGENGRTLSTELPKALRVMPGMKFRARKTSSQGKDRTFHNLYVNSRIGPPPPALPDGPPHQDIDDVF